MSRSSIEEAFFISAEHRRGNNKRIELCGIDLIFGGIDNLFVYPDLNIDRLKISLSKTLSDWPIVSGRVQLIDDRYFIEMSDNEIPLIYREENEMEKWSKLPVVVDDPSKLSLFIDSVKFQVQVEPLCRLKLTRIIKSNECVLGISFSHLIGDAKTNIDFLNDLSQNYQNLPLRKLRPKFERFLLNVKEENIEMPSSYLMKQYRLAGKKNEVLNRFIKENLETDPIHVEFSSSSIDQLHNLINESSEKKLSKHDSLCAYFIFALNKYYFENAKDFIRRCYIMINYRGVDDKIAPDEQAANSIVQILSEDFENSLSFYSIGKRIRRTIEETRRKTFLENYLPTINVILKDLVREERVTFVWENDELVINSNYRYDWSNLVNFGFHNECQFHTGGLFKSYIRIFRLNPRKTGENIFEMDQFGAEVSTRVERGERKEFFLRSIENDMKTNFCSIE